jgi:hypothetical protein
MRTAFILLDDCNWTPEFRSRMQAAGITEDDLAIGVETFVRALDLFIRDGEVTSPVDAFGKSGFARVRLEVQQVMFEKFGEVMTGGWFMAVRDVTLRGKMSDAATQTAAMVAAGILTAASLRNSHDDNTPLFVVTDGRYAQYRDVVEAVTMREAAVRATQQSLDDVTQMKMVLNTKEQQIRETSKELELIRERYDAVCARDRTIMSEIRTWESANFIHRLCLGAKLCMKVILKREILDAGNVMPDDCRADGQAV